MKYLGYLAILLTVTLSSCKKYKLNQPAYLSFSWDFFQNTSNTKKVTIQSGSFYIDAFRVDGARKEGPNVSINQSLPLQETTFSSNGTLGLSMDVPVGEYTEFNVELNVKDVASPCLVINGSYNNGVDEIPIRVEWVTSKKLNFKPQNGFKLEKKNDYKVVLGIDVERLFSTVSVNQLLQATISNENGIPTMVVRENLNEGIFNDLEEQLPTSLILKVN